MCYLPCRTDSRSGTINITKRRLTATTIRENHAAILFAVVKIIS